MPFQIRDALRRIPVRDLSGRPHILGDQLASGHIRGIAGFDILLGAQTSEESHLGKVLDPPVDWNRFVTDARIQVHLGGFSQQTVPTVKQGGCPRTVRIILAVKETNAGAEARIKGEGRIRRHIRPITIPGRKDAVTV